MIRIRPIKEKDIPACSTLLGKNFRSDSLFSEEYLSWLYFQNPQGKVLGYNAWKEEKLVAHYASIPIKMLRNGVREKSLLSLNSVTDLKFRRQGLFVTLAKETYKQALKIGYSSVIGVSNKQATSTRLKELNFHLVCPLQIAVGFGNLNIDGKKLERASVFRRHWSKTEIMWRRNNPNKNVLIEQKGSMYSISSSINKMFVSYAETPFLSGLKKIPLLDSSDYLKLRVFVGTIPDVAKRVNLYLKLPDILKPSPFNLIYKSLNDSQKPPYSEDVFFNFFDFDVL